MTHPLTPREKVAAAIIDSGVNIGTSTWPDDIQVDALKLSDAILTALASGSGDQIPGPDDANAPSSMGWPSAHGEAAREQPPRLGSGDHSGGVTDMIGSGDHAELAHDIRKLCVGHPHAKIAWPHYELHAIADRAEALLAESAALRARLDERHLEIAEDEALIRNLEAQNEDAETRATEAERKLAEAVGLNDRAAELMRQCTDPERFEGASTLNVYANMRAWLSDISKEAERG